MEIEDDESRLNILINTKDHTASVMKSPKATGDVFIPRFIQHDNAKYTIKSIDEEAFSQNKIESIRFPDDSEVSSFKKDAFQQTSIKKLQIPKSLTRIEAGCFFLVNNLTSIEISKENKLFQFFDEKFLLGKSNAKSDIFDILIYGRFDLEEAEIPSFVKVLKRNSFNVHLKSLIFPENSQIESIEFGVINKSFKKLMIPGCLRKIDQNCFQVAHSLIDAEVSTKNEFFSYLNEKFLLTKSGKKNFDQIIFCRRDATEANIPKSIKKICSNAFSRCNQLKSVTFDQESSLEIIDSYAFSWSSLLESIVIPPSVKLVGSCAFYNMNNLISVQLLADEITVEDCCFQHCNNLKEISFPNATKIFIDGPIPANTKVMVKKDVELTGDLIEENSKCFQYDDKSVKDGDAVVVEEEEEKEEAKIDESELKTISMTMKQFNEIVEHVRFLEKHLNKFEDIEPFDFDLIIGGNEPVIEEEEEKSEKDKKVVNEEEEEIKENDVKEEEEKNEEKK